MSNEIRPSVDAGGKLVLEIAVESTVQTFTWVILDQAGKVVAGDEVDRGTTGGGVPLGQEFSVIVTDAHGHYWHGNGNGKGKGEDEREAHAMQLGTGDYQVQLYLDHPQRRGSARTRFGKLELLDEDAFSVLNEGVVAPAVASDVGAPLRVALVREGTTGEAEPRSPVTYAEFRKFLEAEWGRGEEYDDANSWPVFGGKPYEALRSAARDFVAQAKVTSFGDLLPPGYADGKLAEAETQFPAVQLPRDARTPYLPGVELIWNYWLEEGMLVQTLNVILARFQNRRLPGRDPLVRFDVTPLLPAAQPPVGLRRGRDAPAHRPPSRGRVRVRVRVLAHRSRRASTAHGGRAPQRLHRDLPPGAVPRPPLLQGARRPHRAGRRVPALPGAARLPHRALAGHAEPVRRDGRRRTRRVHRDAEHPGRAADAGVPRRSADDALPRGVDGPGRQHEVDPGLDRHEHHALQRPGRRSASSWSSPSGSATGPTPSVGGAEAATWAQAFRYGIQKYAAAYRTATGVDLAEEPNAEKPSTLLARRLAGTRIRA